MTDKQIIIDEIDVSGCKHYKNRTCIADYCLTDMPFGEAKCELNPNCYYKQLKRKEQECEELKRQRQADKGLITSTGKMNYQLIQEYDKLKSENKHLNDLLNQALKELEKTRETLTEIKEIAEKIANYYDGDEYELMRKDANQILQKISECEGNDEM